MPKVVVTDKKGLVQETGEGFVIDNNDDDKPGYIVLTSANGTQYFLHVNDDGNKLTLSPSIPTADAASAGDDKAADFA